MFLVFKINKLKLTRNSILSDNIRIKIYQVL